MNEYWKSVSEATGVLGDVENCLRDSLLYLSFLCLKGMEWSSLTIDYGLAHLQRQIGWICYSNFHLRDVWTSSAFTSLIYLQERASKEPESAADDGARYATWQLGRARFSCGNGNLARQAFLRETLHWAGGLHEQQQQLHQRAHGYALQKLDLDGPQSPPQTNS